MSDNILLAYGNKATGATLAGGSWDSPLVLDNLKTGDLAEVARSTNTLTPNTQFLFNLGANYVLRALALVNHNLTTAARWRLRVGTAAMDVDYSTEFPNAYVAHSGGANRTRVNSAGLIASKTAPRIDYDPVTLANKGLLIEEQRTNLLTYSADLSNGDWFKNGVSVGASITSPTGAVRCSPAARGHDHRLSQQLLPAQSRNGNGHLFADGVPQAGWT